MFKQKPTRKDLELLCLELMRRLNLEEAHVSERKVAWHANKKIRIWHEQFGAKFKYRIFRKH